MLYSLRGLQLPLEIQLQKHGQSFQALTNALLQCSRYFFGGFHTNKVQGAQSLGSLSSRTKLEASS